jgi:hypothetical protein
VNLGAKKIATKSQRYTKGVIIKKMGCPLSIPFQVLPDIVGFCTGAMPGEKDCMSFFYVPNAAWGTGRG